jgi:hypothetical protein
MEYIFNFILILYFKHNGVSSTKTLKIRRLGCLETSITDHPITQRHILEKVNPKQRRCENIKIRILETGFPSGDCISLWRLYLSKSVLHAR